MRLCVVASFARASRASAWTERALGADVTRRRNDMRGRNDALRRGETLPVRPGDEHELLGAADATGRRPEERAAIAPPVRVPKQGPKRDDPTEGHSTEGHDAPPFLCHSTAMPRLVAQQRRDASHEAVDAQSTTAEQLLAARMDALDMCVQRKAAAAQYSASLVGMSTLTTRCTGFDKTR